jgi:RNA polymerase sigma-70 factor (ECF subfamily)
MFTIARRRVVDVVRRSTARPDLTPFVSEHQDVAPGPEDLALAADALGELTDRLHLLPPAQSEVILLRVVSGLDVAEIAKIVEKSPGAVRVLSHRGLSTLLEMENAHAANRARRAAPIAEEASTG